MAEAGTYFPRSTRALAWSFAIGAVVLVAAGLVGLIVATVREVRR